MSSNKNNLSGSWLGNYYYESSAQPFGFEAVFAEMNGNVEGSILDDGKLGEALVIGTFADPLLTFSKKYGNSALEVVSYEGTISDEGKKLSGTWQIKTAAKGSWLAWRQDEEEVPQLKSEESAEAVGVLEKVLVRRLTRKQE